MSETRIKRFKKIGEKRVNKLLEDMRLLGNCSNKANYEYSGDDVKKMFAVLDREYRNLKNKFSRVGKKEEFKF